MIVSLNIPTIEVWMMVSRVYLPGVWMMVSRVYLPERCG